MFTKTAKYYDLIYGFKDYQAEAVALKTVIFSKLGAGRWKLLDAACGTGKHLALLQDDFACQGLDLNDDLLEVARQRCPNVVFHQADMADFHLGERFDVITCLFSSIGYLKTVENLNRGVSCLAQHLAPGGLLLVEPWFTPEAWKAPGVHMTTIDLPELKIARVNTSLVEGRLSFFEFHYLVGTPQSTEHFVERHELGLFTLEEMDTALVKAGLTSVDYDEKGLTGRGLWSGRKKS